ncbi:MAG TPA: 4-(cytidine 5'-diphospho)-2-C-methyl-D-erythritol kinase [Thermoanaerobacterales bacterium]|nr:4-(cytidine 5'-diphospho)-2-C-methyl-D-erythritol kinase [Thermoanaerobacterales bacterium]
MFKLDIDARAKINITLDVLYRRPDGYHEVEMIMQSIALKDHLTLELMPGRAIEVCCDAAELANDETNLAYKAAKLMMDEFGLDAGVKITLRKNIPMSAGLAGGSADAAAVMIGMNELFDLKKSGEELMMLGKTIGADIPFCIHGGTAVARGIGEKLTPLKPMPQVALVLVKPPYSVSTKQVYSRLDVKDIRSRPDTAAMIRSITDEDVATMARGLCNVLEEVTFELYPELFSIKEELKKNGALGSLMSGSGPTIYGIFETRGAAQKAAARMATGNKAVIISETQ